MITPPDAVSSLLHLGDESTRPLRLSLGVGSFFVLSSVRHDPSSVSPNEVSRIIG